MMERIAAWYWKWFGDIMFRDFEEAINNPDFEPNQLWFLSPRQYFELIGLLLLFPVGVASTIWVVEVRGKD